MKRLLRSFFSILSIALVLLFVKPYTAAASTITVCSAAGANCAFAGAGGIQEAVEAAKDGDTILIQPGTYTSTQPIVVDPNYKYKNCLVDTKGKKINIKGAGATIDNANGSLDNEANWSTGICVLGGEVTVDSIAIRQTLRPAIYIDNARAVIKNITTIDIDNSSIDVHNSQVMIFNSVLTGGGIGIYGNSYARIENNVLFSGGISFDLCKNNEISGDVSNNIIVRAASGVAASCQEQTQKLAKIKTANNFVYKGATTGDQSCVKPGNTEGEVCAAGEICTGTTFAWPGFIGADDEGTVCVWGEGRIQGDFNTKPTSQAGLAGAGISKGPCASPDSAQCTNYIASNPLPGPSQPTPTLILSPTVRIISPTLAQSITPRPSPTNAFFNNPSRGPIPTLNPTFIAQLNAAASNSAVLSASTGMDLFLFVLLSFIYIMVMHFALGIADGFNVFLMVIYFTLAGIIGWWFHNFEAGFIFGIILSLIFL